MRVMKMYANCIPVKGVNRSVICDLQRKEIFIIPNDLYSILVLKEGKSIEEIKFTYNHEYDEIIDEYLDFLLENELVFFTDTPELFPKLSLRWEYPFQVSNVIIDFNKDSKFNLIKIVSELNDINCKNTQIRFFCEVSKKVIEDLMNYIDKIGSMLLSIDIIMPSSNEFSEKMINDFLRYYPRINSFSIFNSKINKVTSPLRETSGYILFSKNDLHILSCGKITTQYFTTNIKSFTEGKLFNSCLNGKISIDVNGNIKNCPSMPQSFGNIENTSLREALEHEDFKKYWSITKDEIDVCKNCEFRFVCTDCRAYLEEPNNKYSKPLKCGYSPQTNKWEEWSTNPLKKKAIEYYGMQELVAKND